MLFRSPSLKAAAAVALTIALLTTCVDACDITMKGFNVARGIGLKIRLNSVQFRVRTIRHSQDVCVRVFRSYWGPHTVVY